MRDCVKNPALAKRPVSERDVGALLKLMWETWNDVFRKILGPAERSLVGELRGHRNKWAHQESFSSKMSAIRPENCPPSRRNGVRHHAGIVSVMARNTQEERIGEKP